MLKLIVAHCRNRGIGINNNLPWHLKSDLKRFKRLTVGNKNNAIIMGKNTWHSLNDTPLKNRTNIVLSTTLKEENKDIIIKSSLQNAVKYCVSNKIDEAWIIGGEQLYKNAMTTYDIDELYITQIANTIECDTFFPEIPRNYIIKEKTKWKKENDISYRYVTYKNKINSSHMMYNVVTYNIIGL